MALQSPTTKEMPRTEEHMHKGDWTYFNDFEEIIIIRMLIPGKPVKIYVKYSI